MIDLSLSHGNYDSTADTIAHIERVRTLMRDIKENLVARSIRHDASKLAAPEKDMFDYYTPMLKQLAYGTPKYEATRQEMMQTALKHHYEHNDHHPEHYPNGINDMTLMALIEMLCDWKAASERHETGDIIKSIEHNRSRFGTADLYQIMLNTVRSMGWDNAERLAE